MPVDTRLTYDDYCLLPNDGKRYEIIDGELFVTPSPRTAHQKIVTRLTRFQSAFAEDANLGEVFVAPFDVVFSNFDIVEPDLLYISRERRDVLTDTHVQGAPDLAVETLSPGSRRTDEIKKRDLYTRFVREYWIVDPELETTKVYRQVEGAFARVAELSAEADDTLATPLLPGWSV